MTRERGGDNSARARKSWTMDNLDANMTDNQVTIQMCIHRTMSPAYTQLGYMRNLKYKIYCEYKDDTLTPDDFGYSKLYLKSVSLNSGDIVILNGDVNQTLRNNGMSSPVTYELNDWYTLQQLEIVAGTPAMTFYAPVE